MLESTPRSSLYHVCNRRYERSCKKVFDLGFSRSCNKDRIFSLSPLDSLTRNIPMRNIFKKSDGKAKNQGGGVASTPPWAFSVGEIPWASAG